jgi:hypothetical protein
MITGDCVNCGKLHMWEVPEGCYGKFVRVTCDACDTTYMIYATRGFPYAMTEAEFAEKYVVMEGTENVITLRNPPPPPTESQKALRDIFQRILTRVTVNDILFGNNTEAAAKYWAEQSRSSQK